MGKHRTRCPSCSGSVTLSNGPAPAEKPSFGTARKALKPNRKRRAETFAKNFGPQSRLCRFQVCAVPGCRVSRLNGIVEPDHYELRSQGGDDEKTWPLCQRHHRERHALGDLELFEAKHRVIADVVGGRLRERVEGHAEADECAAFAEEETQGEADRRARRQPGGAIRRARCGVCLRRLTDAETRTP